MAFKGDLKDINLADIFQTLAMNQQEGTLIISADADKRTEVYFSKEGVRLLASGNQKHIRLGELLLKMKKLTPVELDMALARQKMTGELLGQALVDMNVVTADDINECVRKQIEEDIYEVFSWKKAKFEFKPGEPASEFYDPAKMGNPLAFNVNSVIMEAARRLDEWDLIHKNVPSTSTIYTIKDPQAAIPDISHFGFTGEDILQIVKSIDGRSTIDDIVARSPLSKFEVCKIASVLVESGYVAKLDIKETIRIADGLYREGDTEGAIRIYKDSLRDYPSDTQIWLKLAELYETEGEKAEAAVEYAGAAQVYVDSGAMDDGFALYRKAIELSPKNFSIRQKLFIHYCTAHKFDQASKEGLFVAKTYWRMNRLDEARTTLEQILEMSPDNVDALQLLTSIHMDLDQPEEALQYYERLADVFGKKGETEKLIECYRKILVIDDKRGDIRNKLNSLVSKEKKANRKGGNKLAYILVIMLVGLAAGSSVYIYREMNIRKTLAELIAEADKKLTEIVQEDISEKSENELRSIVQDFMDFKKGTSLSFTMMTDTSVTEKTDELQIRIESMKTERNKLKKQRIDANESIYREARKLHQEKNYGDAIEKYRLIDKSLLGEERAELIKGWLDELNTYLGDAKILYKEAEAHKERQQWKLMHEKLLKLLKDYPESPLVKNVELPLVVETKPSGAEVEVSGMVVGRTPCIYMRKPGHIIRLKVNKRGYESPPAISAKDNDWFFSFVLTKIPFWTFVGTGFIESAPTADSNNAYFGTRAGIVYAVDLESGNRTWDYKPPTTFNTFVASPMLDSGKLYIGCFDYNLYVLDAARGKKLWSIKLGSIIRTAPSLIDANGAFFIGCSDKKIYAINSDKQIMEWTYSTGSEVLSSPMHWNNVVYAGSSDNSLYAIGAGTGEKIWSYSTLGPILGKPTIFFDKKMNKELVIVGSSDKAIYAFKTKAELEEDEKRIEWRYATGNAVTSSPFIYGEMVLVTSGDGKLYCLEAATGKLKWQYETKGSISSSPLVVDGVVYFGSSDKYFYAVSVTDGTMLWKHKTAGEVLGGACVSGQYIVVGDDACNLYCFLKD